MSMDVHRLITQSLAIQAIPAPTFLEEARGTYILQQFEAIGLTDLERDELGNVYGCYRSGGSGAPLIVSAHLDSVFPIETDLSITRTETHIQAPGIGDNAIGLAALVLLAGSEQRREWGSDVWFVATVREEGNGNLDGMRAVVNRFQGATRGYIVLEGMAFGQVVHRGLHVQRYRIEVDAPGGHSWIHHDRPSAIHQLVGITNQLLQIPLSTSPQQTLNIGVIQGGTSINARAAHAFCELDLRSEAEAGLQQLEQEVLRILQAAQVDSTTAILPLGSRPGGGVEPSHPIVRLAVEALQQIGEQNISLGIGSTDANVPLSRGYPAICIGITRGGNAHATDEFVEIEPMKKGLAVLKSLLKKITNQDQADEIGNGLSE